MSNSVDHHDPNAIEDELRRLGQAREERERQRARVRELDGERDQLEHGMTLATADTADETLNQSLRRLGAIERERAQCLAYLAAQSDLEEKHAAVLARKHTALLAPALDHPARDAITDAVAEVELLHAKLHALDEALRHVHDALHHLDQVKSWLGDANILSMTDLAVSFAPLEIALAGAKHLHVRAAREHGVRACDALRSLQQIVDVQIDPAKAAGPATPFGFDTFDAIIIDALLNVTDLYVAHTISTWQLDARELHERATLLRRALQKRRGEVERIAIEATDRYRRLVASL